MTSQAGLQTESPCSGGPFVTLGLVR